MMRSGHVREKSPFAHWVKPTIRLYNVLLISLHCVKQIYNIVTFSGRNVSKLDGKQIETHRNNTLPEINAEDVSQKRVLLTDSVAEENRSKHIICKRKLL